MYTHKQTNIRIRIGKNIDQKKRGFLDICLRKKTRERENAMCDMMI